MQNVHCTYALCTRKILSTDGQINQLTAAIEYAYGTWNATNQRIARFVCSREIDHCVPYRQVHTTSRQYYYTWSVRLDTNDTKSN